MRKSTFLISTLVAAMISAPLLAETVRKVRVADVQLQAAQQQLAFPGVTRATNHARITFLVSGNVEKLPVVIGEKVTKGDLLAKVYNPQLLPSYNAANAQVSELNTRIKQLSKDQQSLAALNKAGAVSDNDLEQLETQLASLKASRNTAEAKRAEASKLLKETELRAPFDAVIEQVFSDEGEFVAAGQPVIELSGEGGIEVAIKVPELVLPYISTGDKLPVVFPFFRNLSVTGEIIELGRSTTGQGQLFPVVVSIPYVQGLTAGMTSEVNIQLKREPKLSLPVQAVIDTGDGQIRVFKLVNGVVEQVAITVDSLVGSNVVISSGLIAGDRVVTAGQHVLANGDKVEVIE